MIMKSCYVRAKPRNQKKCPMKGPLGTDIVLSCSCVGFSALIQTNWSILVLGLALVALLTLLI